MWYLLAILVFFFVVGCTWWMGLWSNLITLTNFFIASLVASSFYENLYNTIVAQDSSYASVAAFVSVWIIFFLTFAFLRVVTEFASAYRLKFDFLTEMIGRSVLSVWLAGAFVCFLFFTIHMAPLPPSLFEGGSPGDRNSAEHVGIGPDRLWLAFVQSRSRGALSEYKDTTLFPKYPGAHPDDPQDVRVFDPGAYHFESSRSMRNAVSRRKTLRQ